MYVYLMQHGEAMTQEQHPERPLTAKGTEDVTQIARALGKADLRLTEIWQSGKRRAEQTAAIVAEHQPAPVAVKIVAGLSPNDPVEPIADALRQKGEAVLIAGHLPFLSRLAGFLVTGDPQKAAAQFQMSGVVCLTNQDGAWKIAWMLVPSMMPMFQA